MTGLLQACISLALILCVSSATAAAPIPVKEPDKYSAQIMKSFAADRIEEAASSLAGAMNVSKETMQNALKIVEGKTFDFTKQVIDNNINDALRQIVYYAFIEKVGFVYFRFNFKMSSTGWILTNFNLKSETNELFPKDFVDR